MKKKGGSLNRKAVQPTAFRYTTSPQRRLWVQRVHPLGEYMIFAVVQQMPWLTYRYTGPTSFATPIEDNNGEKGFRLRNNDDKEGFQDVTYTVEASTATGKPYEYFGGSVFEVLAHLYPPKDGYPVLEDTVDPTGDIDILLHVPHPTFRDPRDFEAALDAGAVLVDVDHTGKSLTPLAHHFMSWVFRAFCDRLAAIPEAIWEDMFGDAEAFDVSAGGDWSEGNVADVFQRGAVVVVFVPLAGGGTMSKIQLIAKFPGLSPDHMLEFVLPLRTVESMIMLDRQAPEWNRMELAGFPIESFASIVRGNAAAMKRRSELLTDSVLQHKYWNHVGRQQYLNRLLPQLVESGSISLTTKQRKVLAMSLFGLAVQLFQLKRSDAVDQDAIDSMLSNILPFAFEERYDRLGRRIPLALQGLQMPVYELRTTPYKSTTYLDILRDIAPSFPVQKGGHRRSGRTLRLRRRNLRTRRRKTSRRL